MWYGDTWPLLLIEASSKYLVQIMHDWWIYMNITV